MSLLTQLRTEHVPLQVHLHRISKADSPRCPTCDYAKETVYHYLLDCPTYDQQRARMAFKLGPAAHSVQTLLTDPKALPHLFRFIHDTRRFDNTFGDLITATP
ncbi:hypothetical protein DAEQUDRAFT_675233 [Daedalea quercina L-15889]|uniref:Reverse transcriptase zinc-binding domain-containing protein n=1 Tax=Daedalea quercina L-15889 TaxID=1314783 RepID=A0A165MYP8_9APHY|nr:hypothetical protein DAEQUDRAFT_675233 [Daedalea quercina L-15889]